MEHWYSDLGHLYGGETVKVTLSGNASNVRLLDQSNYSSYRADRAHRYYGGYATRSPVLLQVPSAGHWFVAVDFGGGGGSARAAVQVLPGRLPALSTPTIAPIPGPTRTPASGSRSNIPMPPSVGTTFRDAPLNAVPSLLRGSADEPETPGEAPIPRDYDVFISHASEDKDAVVRPLAQALQAANLQVWYDEFELRIGDSLRRKIDMGLARSRFGVVVLSQAFFRKGWTNYELDGLVTRAVTGEQILLPIWHNVSKQEVVVYSPSLADKVARSTATHTVDEIAAEIVALIRGATGQQ